MAYGEKRQRAQHIGRIIRLTAVGIVLLVVFVTSGTPQQWISLPGKNTIARIWISGSLLITFILTCWLNFELAKDKRYHKQYADEELTEMLGQYRGYLSFCNIAIVVWSAVFISLILRGVVVDTRFLSLVSGPILVLLVLLFDMLVLRMEKMMVKKCKPDENKNQESYEKARAVVWQIDVPILIGVCLTFFFCMLLTPVEQQFGNFIAGFASGATGMQIVIGNVAFEFIHG